MQLFLLTTLLILPQLKAQYPTAEYTNEEALSVDYFCLLTTNIYENYSVTVYPLESFPYLFYGMFSSPDIPTLILSYRFFTTDGNDAIEP